MNTRALTVILVALLVALAGCGGLTGGTPTADDADGESGDGGDGGDGADSDGAAGDDDGSAGDGSGGDDSDGDGSDGDTSGDGEGDSSTPTPDGGVADTPTATPGSGETGNEGSSAFLDRHVDAVGSADGYVVSFTANVWSGGSWANLSGTNRVDLTTSESRQRITVRTQGESIEYDYYRPPDSDTIHFCLVMQGSCFNQQSFSAGDRNTQAYANYSNPFAVTSNATDVPNFRDEGVVDTDDGERRKYVADDVSQFGADDDNIEYETVSVEVLVDPETNRITDFRWDIEYTNPETGEESQFFYEITYDEWGSVDVTQPDWYDD